VERWRGGRRGVSRQAVVKLLPQQPTAGELADGRQRGEVARQAERAER